MKRLIWTVVICAVLLIGVSFFAKSHFADEEASSYVPPTASEVIEQESANDSSQNYFWATIG